MSPSMKRLGPISYRGIMPSRKECADLPPLNLCVMDRKLQDASDSGHALMHPATCSPWQHVVQDGLCFLQLAKGSDCVLTASLDEGVQQGAILLDRVQQHNLHVAAGERFDFSVFLAPEDEPLELHDLEGEARLFRSREASTSGSVEVDAGALRMALSRQLFGRMAAVNELVLVPIDGMTLIVRVVEANTLDEAAREEAVGYHCYRGLVTPETSIWLATEGFCDQSGRGSAMDLDSDSIKCSSSLVLVHNKPRPPKGRSSSTLDVLTRDGEAFPVKRKLLRSCIALTAAVRSEAPGAAVDVDTLVFDRVLMFLEADALGQPPPDFAVHLLGDLLHAAETLGLRSLQDYCLAKLGKLDARIALRSFEEVKARNAAGQCWLILDGMVLDVTRWLPEHPGGRRIIPAQALDLDCARMFEVYHASRESFLYLQEFYCGELDPRDRPLVPCPDLPSQDFLAQLRKYTCFRSKLDECALVKAFASF